MSVQLDAEEILRVPSVAGDGLDAETVAELPSQTPPAPWHSNVHLAAWGFRATAESRGRVAPPLAPGLGIGAAAFISYLDGAVGPYHEVLATPRCVRRAGERRLLGSVPFIAVDSFASIHGGRTNWALPKLRAGFSGEPGRDARLRGEGADWCVQATVTRLGPWLPFRAAGAAAQPWPGGGVGIFRSAFRGRMRLARLEVEVSGPRTLTAVLPSGRFLGAVITGSVDVGAPRVG